ncbi:MAG: DUF1778 domain-containing protein [Gammaproteobacteria bacterium]|nr:DUF1778 domain-containing protein [Gammaproteobacteria bacterium]
MPNMTGSMRTTAKEKVKEVIDQEARLVLTRPDFDKFVTALERPFTPNRALREALVTARQTVKRA